VNPATPELAGLAEAEPDLVISVPETLADQPPGPNVDPRNQLLPFAFAKRHGVLINGSENGRPLPAGAVRPARERGRRTDHPADQRPADFRREGQRIGHPHRTV
jgi:hypothetical protein